MKRHIFTITQVILFVALPFFAQAQIPNPSFEQWTDGQPDGWLTTNLTGIVTNITQSTISQSGSYAARGEVITYATYPYPPTLVAGGYGSELSVSQRHAAVTGFYQFTSVEGDRLIVTVAMWQDDTLLGAGEFEISAGTSSYTQFEANIDYLSGEVPNLCEIAITISGASGDDCHVGSVMLIDNLSFSGITSVQNDHVQSQLPEQFALGEGYPNPFNPTCVIKYAVPEISNVSIRVYDITGREITTLFQGVNVPGNHQVLFEPDRLPGGLYLYRMTATALKNNEIFSEVRKVIYIK
jgi:hypothetical protein